MTGEFARDTYTTPCANLIGCVPNLGDVVASGIEPGRPVGRIVAFVKRKPASGKWFGNVLVADASGEVRRGALGIAWVGYCRREDWDGPTPNGLGEILWAGAES